jgi:hypothetical protein
VRRDVLNVLNDADDREFLGLLVPLAHALLQKSERGGELEKVPALEAVHEVVSYHASVVIVAPFWLAAPGLEVLLPSRADAGADSEECRNYIRNLHPTLPSRG